MGEVLVARPHFRVGLISVSLISYFYEDAISSLRNRSYLALLTLQALSQLPVI